MLLPTFRSIELLLSGTVQNTLAFTIQKSGQITKCDPITMHVGVCVLLYLKLAVVIESPKMPLKNTCKCGVCHLKQNSDGSCRWTCGLFIFLLHPVTFHCCSKDLAIWIMDTFFFFFPHPPTPELTRLFWEKLDPVFALSKGCLCFSFSALSEAWRLLLSHLQTGLNPRENRGEKNLVLFVPVFKEM